MDSKINTQKELLFRLKNWREVLFFCDWGGSPMITEFASQYAAKIVTLKNRYQQGPCNASVHKKAKRFAKIGIQYQAS